LKKLALSQILPRPLSLNRLVAFHTGPTPPPKLAAALAAAAPELLKTGTFTATVSTSAAPATAVRFFGAASKVGDAAAQGVARYLLLAGRKVHTLPAVGTTDEDEAPALATLIKAFVTDPEAAGAAGEEVPLPTAGRGASAAGGVAGLVAAATAAASAAIAKLPPPVQARLAEFGAVLAAKGVDPARAGLAGAGLVAALAVGALAGGGGAPAPRRTTRRKRD